MKNETIETLENQMQKLENQLRFFEARETDLRDKIAFFRDLKRQLQERKKQIEQTIADTKYNEWLKNISKYDYVLPYAC